MTILFKNEPLIEEAEGLYQQFVADDEVQRQYDREQMYIRDRMMMDDTLLDRGRQEGEQKGVIKTARNMKKTGVDIAIIK